VRQSVDEHRTLFRDHGIAVTVSVPPDDLWVEGDPARLRQVFANILHNAGKFTPKNGWVTVRLLRDAASRDAVVEIADTGIGMDRALLERVFVPFVCAPGARTPPTTASGSVSPSCAGSSNCTVAT